MARQLKAKIRLDADTKNANRNLRSTDKELKNLESSSGSLGGGLGGLTAKFGALAAGAAVVAAGIGKLIGLANEEEDAVQKLDAAIGNLNGQRKALSLRLQENASALSAVTRSGNEEILAVQAQIAIFIKDEDQIKKLTKASLDFAAAQGTNAVAAAQLLTRTVTSSTNALTRQGLVVEGAAGSVERFASAMEALAVFEGQAAAAADTASGKIGLLKDAFVDLLQEATLNVTQSKVFTGALVALTLVLNNMAASTKAARSETQAQSLGFAVMAENVLPPLIARLVGVEGAFEKVTKEILRQKTATVDLANVQRGLFDGFKKSLPILQDWEAHQKLIRKENEKLGKEFGKFGIILQENVNSEIERNNGLLDVLRERYEAGRTSLQQYERDVQKILDANAKLNGTFQEQADIVLVTSQGVEVYGQALTQLELNIDRVGEAEVRLADITVAQVERRIAARAQEQRNLGTQTIFGQRTTQGGTFFVPDSVVGGANGSVEIVRGTGFV